MHDRLFVVCLAFGWADDLLDKCVICVNDSLCFMCSPLLFRIELLFFVGSVEIHFLADIVTRLLRH